MRVSQVFQAWGRILSGYQPALSIEITKACPLTCPGCYAFQPGHADGKSLVDLTDFSGQRLVDGVLELADRYRPMVMYIVGGEPLVRHQELTTLLPLLSKKGIATNVVTSAVRPIPEEWKTVEGLEIVVSIDGLQPEHDARRKPATYERILKHIVDHNIVVHNTVTSQTMRQSDYLERFMRFWSDRPQVRSIQVSLYTPQIGEQSEEILSPELRERAVNELRRLHAFLPKIRVNDGILRSFMNPPQSPAECTFARVTSTLSADLRTEVKPCQLGGTPDCTQCGCLASMGLHAVSDHQLAPGLKVGSILHASVAVGSGVRRMRHGARAMAAATSLWGGKP